MIDESTYIHAHRHSMRNRPEIISSKLCGCFYCLKTFIPNEIKEWTDIENKSDKRKGNRGLTALCPRCGIDSVLGDFSGFPITTDFLSEMYKRWFEQTVSIEECEKRTRELRFIDPNRP